jgi:hypothetical protein
MQKRRLTNPNKRFRAMENWSGFSGSHLHLGGVHETTPQNLRKKPFFGYFSNPGFQDEALSCRLLIQWPRYLHSSLPFPQWVKMVVEPPIPCSVSRQSWFSRCDSEWTRDMEQSSGRDPEGIWDKEEKKERKEAEDEKSTREEDHTG